MKIERLRSAELLTDAVVKIFYSFSRVEGLISSSLRDESIYIITESQLSF